MTARGAAQRRLEVRVLSDARGFSRGFQQASRETQSFSKQMDTASKTGIGRFNSGIDVATQRLRTFAGITAGLVAGGALFRWAGSARDSANALTESINAVDVVFEEGAGRVLAFGENAAESAGLAKSAFNEAVTPIGALLRNFGFDANEAADAAVTLTQRAADLASVFNTDVNEALDAIASGLRGESNPLERFGASISAARVEQFLLTEGLVASKAEIDDTAKVLGRYQLILEDTARVAGDFTATADENANKTRIFQARLEDLQAAAGQKLIPLFNDLVGVGEDLLPVFESLATDVVPALVEIFGDFLAGVGAIVETVAGLPDTLLATAGGLTAVAGAAALVYAHPVIAGLGLVAAGIVAIGDAARDEQAEIDEFKAAIEELANTGDRRPLELEIQTDFLEALAASEELRRGMELLKEEGVALEDLVGFVLGDEESIRLVTRAFEAAREAAEARNFVDPTEPRSLALVIGEAESLANRYGKANEEIAATRAEQERLNALSVEFGSRTASADRLLIQRAKRYQDLTRAQRENADATTELSEAEKLEIERAEELAEAVDKLAGKYADELNKAAQDYLTIFEGVEEVEPVQGTEQLLANAEARIEVISGFLSGIQRLREEGLFELAFEFQSAGVSGQNVAELEAVIEDIDRGGSTAFELDQTLQAAREEISGIAAEMGLELARSQQPLLRQAQTLGIDIGKAIASGIESVRLQIALSTSTSTSSSGATRGTTGGGGVRAQAGGGRFFPGEISLVGEHGPEVVQFDSAGNVHRSVEEFLGTVTKPAGPTIYQGDINITFASEGNAVDVQRAGHMASVLRKMET